MLTNIMHKAISYNEHWPCAVTGFCEHTPSSEHTTAGSNSTWKWVMKSRTYSSTKYLHVALVGLGRRPQSWSSILISSVWCCSTKTEIIRNKQTKWVCLIKWCCKQNDLELKERVSSCLIWSVALYAAETWTLTKVDIRRLEAFEMWVWLKN